MFWLQYVNDWAKFTKFFWNANFFAMFKQQPFRHSKWIPVISDQVWQVAKPYPAWHAIIPKLNTDHFLGYDWTVMSQMDATVIVVKWFDSSMDIAQIKTLM